MEKNVVDVNDMLEYKYPEEYKWMQTEQYDISNFISRSRRVNWTSLRDIAEYANMDIDEFREYELGIKEASVEEYRRVYEILKQYNREKDEKKGDEIRGWW